MNTQPLKPNRPPLFRVLLVFGVSLAAFAQESAELPVTEAAPAAVEPAAEPAGAPAAAAGTEFGFVTPWTRLAEDYSEGLLDVLIPLFHSEKDGLLLFTNFRTAYSDRSEQELNLGLGVRKHSDRLKGILGANVFYDSRWTERDSQFNQLGAGVEYLSNWVDFRANAYVPENDKELLGTTENTYLESSSTRISTSNYAKVNTIYEREQRTTVNRFVTETYKSYEVPLEGYDLELGVRIPLNTEWLELRLFGGYYSFSPVWDGNVEDTNHIEGFKGRAEFRIHENLYLDAEVFEDDRLFGSDYLISARLRLPFEIGAIARGENPFRDRSGESTLPRSRLMDMVMRDPHIQIRQETRVESSRSEQTRVSVQTKPVLKNVIFVDGDNTTDPNENGTAENPFDLIQEGVDKSAATNMRNVFVFGASNPYRENVEVGESIRLIGGGTRFRNGKALGDGSAPVVQSNRSAPFLFTFDGPSSVFFSGFVLDGSTTPGEGVPLIGGAHFIDVPTVVFTQNSVRGLPVGVLGSYTSTTDYSVNIVGNSFADNGIAIAGLLSSSGEFNVVGNSIKNAVLGVGVLSLNSSGRAYTRISGNSIVSRDPVDAGSFEVIGTLLGALPSLPLPLDAEMSQPTALPLPMIGGIVVAAINGKLTAEVSNNSVNGALLGITGLSLNLGAPRTDLDLEVIGNTVRGGGLVDTLNLLLQSGLLDSGLLDGIGLPLPPELGLLPDLGLAALGPGLELPFDAGLSGIAVLSIGDGARVNDAVISGNRVSDNLLGITLGAAMDGVARRGHIVDNTLTDNLLGITAIGALGGNLNGLNIADNRVDGGGIQKLLSLLEDTMGPVPFDVPDFSLAGITLIGYDATGMNDISIEGNTVKGHLLGISALAFAETNMRDLRITENTLENNFSGVLLYGLGEQVNMARAEITHNSVSGTGTAFAANLLGGLLGSGPLDFPDWGLSGIAVAGVNGARMNEFVISDNTVRNQLLGITAFSFGDANLRNGLITENSVEYGVAGVLGVSLSDGNLNALTVTNNTVTGVGVGLPSPLSFGPFSFFGDKATAGIGLLVNNARARNALLEGNTIANNIAGILVVESGGNINGLLTPGNTFENNDADIVVNP